MVQKGVYNKFVEALTQRVKGLKVGPGTKDGVFVGPLTHDRAIEKALKHIEGAWSSLFDYPVLVIRFCQTLNNTAARLYWAVVL